MKLMLAHSTTTHTHTRIHSAQQVPFQFQRHHIWMEIYSTREINEQNREWKRNMMIIAAMMDDNNNKNDDNNSNRNDDMSILV